MGARQGNCFADLQFSGIQLLLLASFSSIAAQREYEATHNLRGKSRCPRMVRRITTSPPANTAAQDGSAFPGYAFRPSQTACGNGPLWSYSGRQRVRSPPAILLGSPAPISMSQMACRGSR